VVGPCIQSCGAHARPGEPLPRSLLQKFCANAHEVLEGNHRGCWGWEAVRDLLNVGEPPGTEGATLEGSLSPQCQSC